MKKSTWIVIGIIILFLVILGYYLITQAYSSASGSSDVNADSTIDAPTNNPPSDTPANSSPVSPPAGNAPASSGGGGSSGSNSPDSPPASSDSTNDPPDVNVPDVPSI